MKAVAHRMIFLASIRFTIVWHDSVGVCDLGIHKMAQHLIRTHVDSSNAPFVQTVVATKEYFSIVTYIATEAVTWCVCLCCTS